MELAMQVQIPDKAICILFCANASEKAINPSIHPPPTHPAMDK